MKTRKKTVMTAQMMNPPNTLDYCIFCVRKISKNPSFRKAVISAGSGSENLTVVPHAVISSITDLLSVVNMIWPYMQTNQGQVASTGITLKGVMQGSESKVVSHAVLPPICQLCADQVLQVEGLMKAVRSKVEALRRIITDSKRDGLYSWRMVEFEKNLKQAGLGDKEVRMNLQYWDHLGDNFEIAKSTSASTASYEDTLQRKRQRTPKFKTADGKDASDTGEQPIIDQKSKQFLRENSQPASVFGSYDEGDTEDMDTPEVKNEPIFDSEEEEDEDSQAGVEQFGININNLDNGETIAVRETSDDNKVASEPEDEDGSDDDYIYTSDTESDEDLMIEKRSQKKIPSNNSGATIGVKGGDKVVHLNGDLFNSSWEYLCPKEGCDHAFNTKRSLEKHQKQDHPSCTCSCGKSFPGTCDLRKHQKYCKDVSGRTQKCDMCKESINFQDILEHVQNHVGVYALKCPNDPCPYVFSNTEPIQQHIKNVCNFNPKKKKAEQGSSIKSSSDGSPSKRDIHWGDYLYKCEECGYESYHRQVFRSHIRVEHERASNLRHHCPVTGCDAIFTTRYSVDFHLSTHKFWKSCSQKCELCSETLKPEEMADHLTTVHQHQELFSCPHCPFILPGRTYYVEHLDEHRHLGFFCDICGRDVTFSQHHDLRRHYETEHQVKFTELTCKLCGNVLSTRVKLQTHVKAKHPAAASGVSSVDGDAVNQPSPCKEKERVVKKRKQVKRMYPCDICLDPSITFSDVRTLCSHKIKMHGMEPLQCKTCGQQFSHPAYLATHVKDEHEGVKKEYPCPEPGCGKVFDMARKLKRHLQKSRKDKNVICEECGKGFATSGELRSHHDGVHLGLKLEVCEICGKSFATSSVLRRHKLIHTGQRPYECDQCGQRFLYKDVMQKHVQNHTERGDKFKPKPRTGTGKRRKRLN